MEEVPQDAYPFWWATGVVYEHFHTAKTVRSGTTKKLVPEMYVEMHPDDAQELGRQGRRLGQGHHPAADRWRPGSRSASIRWSSPRAQHGAERGFLFSPWNLSVADSADPKKNKWLANGTTHRAFDPVSGQADFKKCAARVEPI